MKLFITKWLCSFAVFLAIILIVNYICLNEIENLYFDIFGNLKTTISTAIALSLFYLISDCYRAIRIYALLWYVSIFLSLYFTNETIVLGEKISPHYRRVLAVTEANNIAINFALLLSLLSIIPNLFTNKYIQCFFKTFCAVIWTVISIVPIASCAYYILFDAKITSDTVIAIYQTNLNEAIEFVSHQGFVFTVSLFLLFVFIFIIAVTAYRIKQGTSISNRAKLLTGLSLFVTIISVLGLQYHNATLLIKGSISVVRGYVALDRNYEERMSRLSQLDLDIQGREGLFVFVIGESLNRDHLSLYNYKRNTTPWQSSMLSNNNFIIFNNAYSNAVITVHALSKALTSWDQYNAGSLSESITITDLTKASNLTGKDGFYSTWISNQSRNNARRTPQSIVAASADNQIWINNAFHSVDFSPKYDEAVIDYLNNLPVRKKQVVIIHLMGNHIEYNIRYPESFNFWNSGSVVDNYDNSVLYNDYVLKEIYTYLSKRKDFKLMLYMPDHGEDMNLTHNPDKFTYSMARIPMWIAMSPSYMDEAQEKVAALKINADKAFTNDMFFDTYCGLLEITNHPFYKKENDLSSTTFEHDVKELVIHDGKFRVIDDPMLNINKD